MVKSILKDDRIDAFNALIEISIGDYLAFARQIIDNNEFQRKKVIKSKIKEILKEDLLRNCLIPSIVLAVSSDAIGTISNVDDFEGATQLITSAIASRNIMIIDGLQRTFVLLDLEEELQKDGRDNALQQLYSHRIRAEVYLGLNRVGLLYRMITLNTGQTTMSTRHLMEILYLDYARIGVDGIKFVKDKDESVISETTNEYNFKVVLDGFNSYLEKSEALIERTEILDNIKSLDVLKKEEIHRDLFKDFLLLYKSFLDGILQKSNRWAYNAREADGEVYRLNANPFGKTVLDIFKKSQALTGFGAAVGYIRDTKNSTFDDIRNSITDIRPENDDWSNAIYHLLKHLDLIKERSKKIGNDQRYFFKYFFRGLLHPDSDTYLNFNQSSDFAYNTTRIEKEYK